MLFSCIIISCYPIKVRMKTQRTSIPRYGRLLLSFVSQCPICQNTFRTDHTLLQGPVGRGICCALWLRHFTLIANLTYTPNVMHLISCMTLVSGALRLRVANVCNYNCIQLCQALFTVRVDQLYSCSQASPYNSQH